jgi:hypothetical protein
LGNSPASVEYARRLFGIISPSTKVLDYASPAKIKAAKSQICMIDRANINIRGGGELSAGENAFFPSVYYDSYSIVIRRR